MILGIISAIYIIITANIAYAHGEMTVLYKPLQEPVRYTVVTEEKKAEYLNSGWLETQREYNSAVTAAMYSDDGRVLYCSADMAEAQSRVGWYYAPRYKMYAPDGRTCMVNMNEIAEYESVGWFIEPVSVMSGSSGEARYVIKSEMNDYKNNGWFVLSYAEGLTPLKDSISEYLNGKSGDWGVYVKNLNTGESLILNDKESYSSASIIKLFVMASVYNEIAYGSIINDSNTQWLLRNMITVSDNYSSNQLVRKIGGGNYKAGFNAENLHTKSLGCTHTQHQSLFIGCGDYVSYGRNLVEPEDCGIVLEKIYRHELVSPQYSEEMLNLLKAQQRTSKIPQPLPEGTVTANKTGETSTVESDVAIVYSPACDYIICTLSNNCSSGIYSIRDISRMVYDYFN